MIMIYLYINSTEPKSNFFWKLDFLKISLKFNLKSRNSSFVNVLFPWFIFDQH